MKTSKRILVLVILLAAATLARAATNDLTSLLQQGLFEEEANRNLDAAIANYQALATQFDKDRQVAATAVFRLGEVYRKLGKTNEAVVQYQRILRDFSDQQTLATLSRQNLTGLGTGPEETGAAASSASRAEQRRLIEKEIQLAEEELAAARNRQAAGVSPREEVIKKEREVLTLRRQLAALSAGQPGTANLLSTDNPPVTDDEEKEIRRIQQLIQNSPDLINAPRGGVNGDLTPLVSAVSQGYLRVAQYLLDHGADVNLRMNNSTPLHSAVLRGNKAMIELLLSRGADINARDGGGDTPLHTAVRSGFRAVAEALLDHKADVNARNNEDNGEQTPLQLAAFRGNVDLTGLLLSKGADANAKERTGDTPLHGAALSGTTATIKALLDVKADINARNNQGETPLLVAAKYGKSDAAMALLAAGADPKLATTAQGWMNVSPLHWAVAAGDEKLTLALLEHGADPNLAASQRPTKTAVPAGGIQTGGAGTALETACEQDKPALVKILLEHGADPNTRRSDSMPLVEAFWFKPDILKVLLEHKADPNLKRADGETALHAVAASGGSTNSVALLVEHGANINAQAEGGSTPLHLAVERNHPELVAALLTFKADPNIRNNNGETPLELAKRSRSRAAPPPMVPPVRFAPAGVSQSSSAPEIDMASLLREHGALDNLPHLDRITLARPSASFSKTIFHRNNTTNNWNAFTLLELLGVQYQFLAASPDGEAGSREAATLLAMNDFRGDAFSFPDLAHVRIRRPSTDGKSWQERVVDVSTTLNSGDCSKDELLQWGDEVVLPETDHPLNERWNGFSGTQLKTFRKCLTRTVNVVIKGSSTEIAVGPKFEYLEGNAAPYVTTKAPVWILPVLRGSNLLLSSSDLSRVKVTRRDGASGKTQSWTLDCSNSNNALLPDLWLRDGDLVEVPEK